MRRFSVLGLSASTLVLAIGCVSPAWAQTTGTLDFEKEIVVTGTKLNKGIDGVVAPNTSKAKVELNQTWIQHQLPGQTVNDMINYVPGVSFTNNDPYGGTSGTLYVRGFDATRISETFDGVTLNDDGNYALYAGELLDSEVIDSVTVNLGTTDVDSPTSSASGSTVNFLSHMPTDKPGGKVVVGAGTDAYWRAFGMFDTGVLNASGTKAWVSASMTKNDSPYNNYGEIKKKELNGKVYQPLGSNGDFLSLAGFYVVLRNNFSGSDPVSTVPLAADKGLGLQYFPTNYAQAYYKYQPCTLVPAVAGKVDAPNYCGTAFDYRDNPANLMNIRAAMRLALAPNLTWTMDPSYQFTKANGGGTVTAIEGYAPATLGLGATGTGYINGKYYLGRDLNGDGDTLDTVTMLAPSETKTHRIALTTSLVYKVAPEHTLRLAYAFARSDITQTGEMGFVNVDGSAANVYPINNPVLDASGNPIEKRDTESIAVLNQISGEYRGQFLDRRLTATIGLRAPFLHRQLDNYCFTTSGSGSASSVTCVYGATAAAFAAANPYVFYPATATAAASATGAAAPQIRTYNYNAVLPNVGLTYKLSRGEAFFNYSKGMSAPQTLSLYPSFYYPQGTAGIAPGPEKTDNFDLGYRYSDSRLSGQIDLWYTHYTNRLGQAYDTVTQTTFYSNLGTVNRYGIDGTLAYRFTPKVTGYMFGSWLHSRIESNADYGACPPAKSMLLQSGQVSCVGNEGYLQTAGRFESGPPTYTIGGRLQGDVGPLTLGMQVKHTGPRYLNDENLPLFSSGNALVANGTVVYPAKTAEYTVVDLDARLSLKALGLSDKSWFQLNVTNLFNSLYINNMGESTSALQTGGTFAQVSPPRAVIASVVIGW